MDKKYKIEYLPIAEDDITNIIHYIMPDNSEAALSMANEFDHSISLLELFSFSGSIPTIRLQSLNYRMLVVGSYLVFCVVLDDTIEIRRILHGKRKYGFLL